jgi:energy-coupling factor transport system ATP-binding protein
MAMIKIEHLSFSYEASHPVLKDINFSILQGQFVALMGHNGSGKSTLAKLLAGLLEVKEGSVTIDSIVLSRNTMSEVRKKLGIVFQNPDNQFIGATVADDLAFGLENRQVPHQQMQTLIDTYASQVGMASFLHQEPSSLSGGQKQRVAIAGVLAMQPKVLLMDEATAMLDPQGKKEIRELLIAIRQSFPSLTILAITHDVEEAVLADQVLVLKEGQLVFQGTPDHLFKNETQLKTFKLNTPFVYQLIRQFPRNIPDKVHNLKAWAKALWR